MSMSPKKTISDKLIIFTRYPVPGLTKSRLIPALGPCGAADVHRRLAENIIEQAVTLQKKGMVSPEICYTGGNIRQMKTWLGKGLSCAEQEEGDLGLRMFLAFKRTLNKGNGKAVLIGTDIPGPVSDKIEAAFNALNEKDIVIGPAVDGGYWLIGMKTPCNIFEGILWGKDTVLSQTLKIAGRKRLSVHLLEPVNDIDTVEDLLAHDPQGDWKNPFVSVIIPVLNEEKRIKKVIESVKNVDAEIIVVDGGSNDRTAEQAERLGVKVVRSPKGRGVQMNAGALESSGNNLLFLHADTILPEKYTHLVFKTLLDIKPVAGAFCFKTDMDNVLMRFIEYIANLRSRFLNLPYGDQGIFMSRASFERAGGYWEVPVAEDIFFIRNIKRFAKIKIVPENAVTSARRWKNSGILKTTFIHLIIMIGCYIGIDPEKLAAIRQMNEPD